MKEREWFGFGYDSRGGERKRKRLEGRRKENEKIQREGKGEGKDSREGERIVEKFKGRGKRGERCKGSQNTWGNAGFEEFLGWTKRKVLDRL